MNEGVSAQMPEYHCHKHVWALKIAELKPRSPDDGTLLMIPANPRYAPFVLDAAYVSKHNPQVGGYYVVYRDGYKSFSPAEAFEDGYTLVRPSVGEEVPR